MEYKKIRESIGDNYRRVYCRLDRLNRPENAGFLKDEYLDMELVYYIRLNITKTEYFTVGIKKNNLKKWDIGEEDIRRLAMENTMRDNNSLLKPLGQMLSELEGKKIVTRTEDSPIYVLTNDSKHFGATCMIYPDALENIYNILKSDFYILPSSVHECIILKVSQLHSCDALRNMVVRINKQELKEEDVLSDSVYLYKKAFGGLQIAKG